MASEPPKDEEAVETVQNPQADVSVAEAEGRPHVHFAGELSAWRLGSSVR